MDLQCQGSNIEKGMLSQYIKGTKPMSDNVIELFSHILESDIKYLEGDFRECESYASYLTFKQVINAPFNKYERLWKLMGYTFMAHPDSVIMDEDAGSLDDTAVEYGVYRNGEAKFFSVEQMEKFYSAAIDFINKYYDKYDSDESIILDEWLSKVFEETKEPQKKTARKKGGK